MIVADTSVVITLFRSGADRHDEAARWYAGENGPLVTTPLALAEIDYLLEEHTSGRIELHKQLDGGGLGVTWWPEALDTMLRVVRQRADVGLTDASLVALAGHLGTNRIATFDERHFRTLKPLTGEPAFTLLPADAD